MATARDRVWSVLDAHGQLSPLSRFVNLFILALIVVSLCATALSTVEAVALEAGGLLWAIEFVAVAVFTVEYVLRVWASGSGPARGRPVVGRLAFMLQPMMIVDLLAILPFYIAAFPFGGPYLRALRLLRLVRVIKATRYSNALILLRETLSQKRGDIAVAGGMMLIVIVVAAFVLYEVENAVQPEAFSSVPATLWWAVATLTTVGYGDIYPITGLGKFLTAIISIVCVGLVALPTAILASGFVESMGRLRAGAGRSERVCPHCGETIPPHEV